MVVQVQRALTIKHTSSADSSPSRCASHASSTPTTIQQKLKITPWPTVYTVTAWNMAVAFLARAAMPVA